MLTVPTVVACLALSGAGQTELLDFTAPWCGPCRQMQPIVDGLIAEGHPVRKVDYDQNHDLAARHNVTAIPCFIMLVDGKEVGRAVGGASRDQLLEMLRRGGAGNSPASQTHNGGAPGMMSAARAPGRKNATFADGAPPVTLRAQSPDAAAVPPTPGLPAPDVMAGTFPSGTAMPGQVSAEPFVPTTSLGQNPQRETLAAASNAIAQHTRDGDKCLASSVRLKVEDTGGNSVGSGTIIDARDGEALVLTCGHIFRESKGKGSVYVDLFGAGAPKHLPAHLIGYDLKRDVGLVSFHTDVPVIAARLAPRDFQVGRGDPVISVGCDNGREPSVRVSHVTSTDKFLPPPNIQVAGQPVEGRSGGGLFTRDGFVIGVCNAADPADDEGLYAGIGSIYSELERKGLTQMIMPAPRRMPAGIDVPAMAAAMPAGGQQALATRAVPTSDAGQRGALADGQLEGAARSPNAAALVDKLQNSGGAEIVCIVRPLSDPHGMSEVLVVDRASPELLRQLAAEGHARPARRLTSLDTKPGEAPQQREVIPTADSWQPNTGIRRYR